MFVHEAVGWSRKRRQVGCEEAQPTSSDPAPFFFVQLLCGATLTANLGQATLPIVATD